MATVTLLEKSDIEFRNACIQWLGIESERIKIVPAGIAAFQRSEDKARFDLPFANIWRKTPVWGSDMRHSHPAAIHGVPYGETDENGVIQAKIAKVHLLPCQIRYTVDYWCTKREQQNELVTNYIWWHRYEPMLQFLEQDPNGVYTQTWDFSIAFEDPQDQSEIESKYTRGKIYRTTLAMTVSGSLVKVLSPADSRIFYAKARIYTD